VRGITQATSAHLNRRASLYLALFSGCYFAVAAVQAGVRPFWNDELFTVHLLGLPSLARLWDALASGVDLVPPLYHLILRGLEPVIGAGPLALRLPSIVGFWVMCLCLYRYVSRRLPAEFAFAAMLLPFCTTASTYMTEARPYGLLLGLAGLALVSWQALETRSRTSVVWRVALTVSLAAAIATHYYAVLLLPALAAGELVRSRARRSTDWSVWICLIAPLAVLLPLLPQLRMAREMAPTYWTSPRIGEALLVYRNWFGHSDWVFVLLAAIVAAAAWRPAREGDATWHPLLADVAPVVVLVAVPMVGALAAFSMGAGFTWRYALIGTIGFAIACSYVLARLAGHSAAMRIAMVVAIALNYEVLFTSRDLLTGNTPLTLTKRIEQRLLEQADLDAPVLVTGPQAFLELSHYASPALRPRVHYVANLERALALVGTDTADRSLLLLSRLVPTIPVGRFPDDLPAASSYYLVDVGPLNWLARELLARGASIALVSSGEGFAVYRVQPGKDVEP
jgi:hypothetical protein